MMERPKSASRDYYYVLGLKPGASQGEIQAAYNELYEKFGPHVSAQELDPEAMLKAYKDINEAYQILMDPKRRSEYDKQAEQSRQDSNDLRDLWLKKTGMPPADSIPEEEVTPSSWVKKTTTGQHPTYEDEQRQSFQRLRALQPSDADAQRQSQSRAPVYQPPPGTPGAQSYPSAQSGSYPGAGDPSYNGAQPGGPWTGSHEDSYSSQANGFVSGAPAPAIAMEIDMTVTLKEAFKGCKKEFQITDPVSCSECALVKPVLRMQCPQCRGVGTYNVERNEEIDLPAGMYEGLEINKPGQGRYDVRAARKGDLIVRIKLAPHPLLGVQGKDITCTIPVTIYEAMLGAEIEAPCATGKVTMKIQPLTQPGRIYRLKGLGLAGGDQLVTIEVVLPARLSGEEVAAYKKLRDMFHEPNPREKFFQQR